VTWRSSTRTLADFVPLLRFPEQHGLSRLAVGRPVIKWEVYPSPASPVALGPIGNHFTGSRSHSRYPTMNFLSPSTPLMQVF
jgi:hypothetical protein